VHHDESVVLLDKATLAVSVHRWAKFAAFLCVEKVTLHSHDGLFLRGLNFNQSFVHIVLAPGEVLLRGVTDWENVAVVSDHVVLEILDRGRIAQNFTLIIRLVEFDDFLEVEGVSCGQEHILELFFSREIVLFALLVTLVLLAHLIGEGIIVFLFVLSARFPLSIAEILILRLLILVNGDLDVGHGDLSEAASTDDLAVHNTLVNLFEEFTILVDVD